MNFSRISSMNSSTEVSPGMPQKIPSKMQFRQFFFFGNYRRDPFIDSVLVEIPLLEFSADSLKNRIFFQEIRSETPVKISSLIFSSIFSVMFKEFDDISPGMPLEKTKEILFEIPPEHSLGIPPRIPSKICFINEFSSFFLRTFR